MNCFSNMRNNKFARVKNQLTINLIVSRIALEETIKSIKTMKICLLLLLAFASSIVLFPSDALACACCAERGAYSISTKNPTEYEIKELKRIQFATANLYMTAGEDDIKGISAIGETYSLTGSLASNLWKFNFKDAAGKSGTLNLTKPVSMVAFSADIHDGDGTGEVVLYKEWRFKYRVQSGTGIFQTGIAPATEYFLVLQGRGNNCSQADDFKHWRLEITGKKASYAFFGELKTPE